MRLFRTPATSWPMSVLCIMALIVPIVCAVLAPQPVLAQAGTIEVAVVDFQNKSKLPNEMFATMCTDAVVIELVRSGKFSVTAADSMRAKMEELGYKSKDARGPTIEITPYLMVRLGEELGAACVVSGELTTIKVDSGKKKAEVRVVVRMLDVASGEFVNGAVASGTSNPRIGYTADRDTDWIIEAINNAARRAVETMVQYIIPEATVVGSSGANEVLLNRGSREGIEEGMEMIVLRRGESGLDEVVGRIRITAVTNMDARARIVQSTRGVRPGDRVRAVYDAPKDTGGTGTEAPRTDIRKKTALGSKLLWGLVALIGLATMFKGGGDRPEEVPGAVAAAFVSPAEFGSAFDEGGILIAWNNPSNLRYSDIMEYHVWRDNHGTYFSEGQEATLAGPVLAPDQTTAAPISCALGSYDHHSVDDIATRSPISYRYPSEDHTSLETGEVDPMLGITPGKTHPYWVSCVYRRQPVAGGEDAEATYWETTPVYAGRATYVARPVSVSPGSTSGGDYVDLSDVTFEWEGSENANQYVLEVSTSPYFERDQTWVGQVYQATSQTGQSCTQAYEDVLSEASELADLAAGTTLYWRVGARNSQDTPGPYPAGPSPMLSGAKSTRYIYSDPSDLFMFSTVDVPEAPDEDDGGSEPPSPP